jgi:hypothetical protein
VGKRFAKEITVRIDYGEENTNGQGLVAYSNNKCYLLTAAHVAVETMYLHESEKSFVVALKWASSNIHPITPLELFIPKTYVSAGINDMGCFEINMPVAFKVERHPIQFNGGTSNIGKVAVGYGLYLIQGDILSVFEEKRMLIQAPSTGGCSGTPLFDNKKM